MPNNQLPPLLYRPECWPESDHNFVTELAGFGGEVLAGPHLHCGRRRCGRFPKNTGQHCGHRNRGTASTPPFGRNCTCPRFSKKQPYPPRLRRIRLFEYPHGESNPGFRAENPTSWATRRWGQCLLAMSQYTLNCEQSRSKCQADLSEPLIGDSMEKLPAVWAPLAGVANGQL